jgi:UDP-2,3-diacylglucosamine hydrolase
LNKIDLPGVLWVAADLHLGPQAPATAEAFLAFLDVAAEEADALLIPGDIFDAWIGDDIIRAAPPWLATVMAALRRTSGRIPVWLGRGNRDFLVGSEFANEVGAHLLPDQALLSTDAGMVLLSHGDECCTDDEAYQQFRTMVRNPNWQAEFLSKTIPERLAMASKARDESISANQEKTAEIMDVNADAVARAFRESGARLMVHGHTHRPARHVMDLDGRKCERWVLPDWDFDHAEPARGGWLAIDRDGLQFYDIAENG